MATQHPIVTIAQNDELRQTLAAHGFGLVQPKADATWIEFYNADTQQRISMHTSRGRVHVQGDFPTRSLSGATVYVTDLEKVSITVAADRAPAAIARDIVKRLLPAYRTAWPKYETRRTQADQYLANLKNGRATLEASGLVTFREPSKFTSHRADDSQEFSINVVKVSDKLYAKASVSGSSVKLHLEGLTPEQAVRVIRALSEG
jgi:hypothetical protein